MTKFLCLNLTIFAVDSSGFKGTTWQTFSESEYEQRISFSDSTFLLETREIDTYSSTTHCKIDSGKHTAINDTICFYISEGSQNL